MPSQWEKIGLELAQSLQGTEDEQAIKMLCEDVVKKINETYTTDNSKKTPMSTVRKVILATFPDTPTKENNAQYFTESGKGNIKRYQHLALKYRIRSGGAIVRKTPNLIFGGRSILCRRS